MRLPLLVVLAVLAAACGSDVVSTPTAVRMGGACMGTTWSAVVTLQPGEVYEDVVASVQAPLDRVDAALSTWKEDSDLSRLNRAAAGVHVPATADTLAVLHMSGGLQFVTDGAFDPTVAPMVRLWGFGAFEAEPKTPSEDEIDAALARLGWAAIELGDDWIARWREDVEVDASAIAKGYGVDAAATALVASGHDAFLLEVGGEVVVRGTNPEGNPWRVGVDDPLPPDGTDPLSPMGLAPRPPIARLGVTDLAVATSGDYRNVRRVDGRVISHAIDPRTGRPVEHTLASATVVSETCATADALATAALVLGPLDGLALLERLKDVEGYLLVRTGNPAEPLEALMTSGMAAYLLDGLGAPSAPLPRGR